MAKIKNNTSSFYESDSLLPSLKFGLDITENSSSKYDFDINLLLSDNGTLLEKQCTDNDNWNGKNIDKGGKSSPRNSLRSESSKFSSLCTLAENHLKQNNGMLPELNFDSDFDLSALLSNDDCSIVNNSKNSISEQSDILFDLSFLTGDVNSAVETKSDVKTDVSFDDLSDWINSSVSQSTDPVQIFHNHERLDKVEDFSPVTIKIKRNDTDLKVSYCFDNIQEELKSKNLNSNTDIENLLGELSFGTSSDSSASNTVASFKTNCDEYKSANLLDSDSDYFPDIDLTFCIKKNSKSNNLHYGNSPETVDSGFDELDFTSSEISTSPEENFFKDNLTSQGGNCNKNITHDKVKQSLFSKAISVESKIEDSRKLKLKSVMNDLLKGTVSLMQCVQNINVQKCEKVIDHSNENVIISSYQKITDQK